MRTKTTAAIVTIALLGVVALSVIGQEEPLPVVIPKASPTLGSIPLAEPTVVLAAEPIRDYRPPTLLDAARHNDYVTFDALYAASKKRGEDVSQFDALHELWTYSVTDPIGAFYGRELYLRLSNAYPGYARYIEELRVVDRRGNEFYPTSETRAFLLDRALEGRPSPRVLVAAATSAPAPTALNPRVERRARPTTEAVVTQEPAAERVATPIVIATKPPVSESIPAAQPAARESIIATQPSARESVVATQSAAEAAAAPRVVADATTAPVASTPVAPPVVIAAGEPAPVPVTPPSEPPSRTASRGVLLMIIGLIGVGILALILRTPREEPLTVIRPAATGFGGNVEPIRKAQEKAADETRAAG